MSKEINIVSFDVPFPSNYGGVIDVYNKLVWLNKLGVKIHLHCFKYGRSSSSKLNDLCEKVYYYKRKTGLFSHLSFLPFTVKSRISSSLANNLLSNDFPILFEVLNTCFLLKDNRFTNRLKIYRHSNIEHIYYNALSKSETNILKKIYLKIEAFKLKRFEAILNYSNLILAVNEKDSLYFKSKYPQVKSIYLPSFHPHHELTILQGQGQYILFHGNLSVSENYEAAVWLITNVFSKISFDCVIAGLNPPQFLIDLISKFKNIRLKVNPSEEDLSLLILHAHIHVLYTSQETGLKLKLLNVLFNGRFIICNSKLLSGTDISSTISLKVSEDANSFIENINYLMSQFYSDKMIEERNNQILTFNNKSNVKKLIESVFINSNF